VFVLVWLEKCGSGLVRDVNAIVLVKEMVLRLEPLAEHNDEL
jgi:hypothetical protein